MTQRTMQAEVFYESAILRFTVSNANRVAPNDPEFLSASVYCTTEAARTLVLLTVGLVLVEPDDLEFKGWTKEEILAKL